MDTDKDKLLGVLFDDSVSNRESDELNKISEAIIGVSQQSGISVIYEGVEVGIYEADLIVEGRVLVELKAVRDLNQIHRAQCMNYLKATGLSLCLLINFGNPRVEVKRIVL